MKTFYIRYQFDSGVHFSDRMCFLKAEDESDARTKFYRNIVDKCKSDEVINNIRIYEFENDMIIDTPYV